MSLGNELLHTLRKGASGHCNPLLKHGVGDVEVELRFEGSEELGYDPLGTPPKGEICLRGPLIFQGYFQDKKKTEEAFGAPSDPLAVLLYVLPHLGQDLPLLRILSGCFQVKAGEPASPLIWVWQCWSD